MSELSASDVGAREAAARARFDELCEEVRSLPERDPGVRAPVLRALARHMAFKAAGLWSVGIQPDGVEPLEAAELGRWRRARSMLMEAGAGFQLMGFPGAEAPDAFVARAYGCVTPESVVGASFWTAGIAMSVRAGVCADPVATARWALDSIERGRKGAASLWGWPVDHMFAERRVPIAPGEGSAMAWARELVVRAEAEEIGLSALAGHGGAGAPGRPAPRL